jgi:hypothetical protein
MLKQSSGEPNELQRLAIRKGVELWLAGGASCTGLFNNVDGMEMERIGLKQPTSFRNFH